MAVHITPSSGSGSASRSSSQLLSLLLILSLLTTDVVSLENGARISVFLVDAVCKYAHNDVFVDSIVNFSEFTDAFNVAPKHWNGSGGHFKKVGDSSYELTVTKAIAPKPRKNGLECVQGVCSSGAKINDKGWTRCIVTYLPYQVSYWTGWTDKFNSQCDPPDKKCWCPMCYTDMCNYPFENYKCGPPHPECPPYYGTTTPAPPNITITTTTEKPFSPGPTLAPPKFSCYISNGCDQEATLEETSDFPECVVTHMPDGTTKFGPEKTAQMFCEEGAENCNFCFISKCNDPKKFCKA